MEGSEVKSYVTLALFLTFGGALFYSFIAFWIAPTYSLSTSVYPLLILAYISQLGLAWIPTSSTNETFAKFRLFFGIILASCMVILLMQLSINNARLAPVSAFFITSGTITTLVTLVLYPFFKKLHKHFLLFGLVFVGFFCMAMILLVLQV